MSHPEYFDQIFLAVGPHVEVTSDFKPKEITLPFTLQVYKNGELKGRMRASSPSKGVLLIKFFPAAGQKAGRSFGLKEEIEAARLFSRICVIAFNEFSTLNLQLYHCSDKPDSELLEEGFVFWKEGLYTRSVEPFQLAKRKVKGMASLYENPFAVPWNVATSCELDAFYFLKKIPKAKRKKMKLLDLGCGYGKNAALLAHWGFEVYGLDISNLAIKRCRTLVNNPRRFKVGSAALLPWKEGFFDIVLDVGCLHCIETLPEVESAIEEIYRVLKPEGRLISRVFRPRSKRYKEHLSFEVEKIGMTPQKAQKLFKKHFSCSFHTSQYCTYFSCHPLK